MKSKKKEEKTSTRQNTGKLDRLVALVVLENPQGVREFLEERRAFISNEPRDMKRGVLLAIGAGGEEAFLEFLELHPHKELFATTEEENNGINPAEVKRLLDSPRTKKKRNALSMMPRWAIFVAILVFLLLLFLGVFFFMKKED